MKSTFALVFLAACLQTHPGARALGRNDCYQCHKRDYESTPGVAMTDPAVPDHLANQALYTTQCATCHVTTTWRSHPEFLFAITTGAHAGIKCDTCHLDSTDNAGDAKGANTQCATCHFATEAVYDDTLANEHQTLAAFSYASPPAGFTPQNFCLSCHPSGTSKHHPDNIFPQGHHARSCKDCHDRTAGPDSPANAPCERCHMSPHHLDRGDPQGCVAAGCHQGGQGGG